MNTSQLKSTIKAAQDALAGVANKVDELDTLAGQYPLRVAVLDTTSTIPTDLTTAAGQLAAVGTTITQGWMPLAYLCTDIESRLQGMISQIQLAPDPSATS